MDSQALHAGAFYFVTPALSQRLDLLRHLIEYSDRLVMVIAERGSGKSALRTRLAETAADNWRIVQVQADPMVDGRVLLCDIVAALDIDVRGTDRQSYLDALSRQMVAFEESSIVPVLMVDDAHELPGEALKLLFGLAQKGASSRGLRTVLFCEPQIRTILDAPALAWLKNSVAHEIDLPGFDWVQTRQYLEESLSDGGDTDLLPIDEHTAQRVHQVSHGLPGLIHDRYRELMSRPTEGAAEAGVSLSKRAAPRHRWRVLTAAVLMAVVTLYIVLDDAGEDGPENASDRVAVPLDLPTQPVDPAGAPVEVAPVRAGGADVPADPDGGREGLIETPARAAGAAPPLREEAPTAPPVTTSPPKKPSPQLPAPRRAEATPVTPAPIPIPAVPPAKPVAEPPHPVPATASGWLHGQRPQDWVLQIFASRNQGALAGLVKRHGLTERAAIVATARSGAVWYVAVLGPYPSRQAAQAAAGGLPAELRRSQPWVRSIKELRVAAVSRR